MFAAGLLAFLILEIWLLAAAALVLHHLSQRTGQAPLLIYLSVLTLWLQLIYPGHSTILSGAQAVQVNSGLLAALSALLLGVLIVYIFDGTVRARFLIISLAGIGLLVEGINVLIKLQAAVSASQLNIATLIERPAWMGFTAACSLALELIVMVMVYQLVSNFRRRTPDVLAAVTAILAACWLNVFISTAVFNQDGSTLGVDLALNTLAALSLAPLISIHQKRSGQMIPQNASNSTRPAMDFFSTQAQLEARARFHLSLLRTLSQVNRMILDTDEPQKLLQQSSQLLVMQRNHHLAWIGLLGTHKRELQIYAWAGQASSSLRDVHIQLDQDNVPGFYLQAVQSGSSVVIPELHKYMPQSDWQHPIIKETQYRSFACFPLRHAGRVLGLLSVYSRLGSAFGHEEADLLQELADNLAYALINLEARRQQAVLHVGAETMEDGMLILDAGGKILYANPSVAVSIGKPLAELVGHNYRQFLPSQAALELVENYYQILIQQGRVSFDYEHLDPKHGLVAYSVATSQVSHGEDTLIVINLRDISRRRQYEKQLVTLNRVLTDMVQAQEIPVLMERLFNAGEELLHADASAVYIADPDRRRIAEYYTHRLPDSFVDAIRSDIRGLPGEKVLQTGQPILIPDTRDDPGYGSRVSIAAQHGLLALMVLPVMFQETGIGTLVMYYHAAHQFQEEELQLGMTLSRAMGILMQNLRLFEAEHNQRQFAEALTQAAAAVNSSLELDDVLDRILEQTQRVVHCRSVNLMLIEGEQARVVRMLDATNPLSLQRTSNVQVPLDLPTLKQMIQSRQALIITDTAQSELWRDLNTTGWVRSYAAAPLQMRDETIGFLSMNSDQPDFFNAQIQPRLEAFAATVASALQNARLYEELRRYSLVLEDRVQDRTAELAEAKERIEQILVSVPDAVFVLDEQKNLVQSNPAGEALLAAAHKSGRADLFSVDFLAHLQAGDSFKEPAVLEVGQRSYQALASGLPGGDTQGGLVIVFRDVTRFRELDQMKTRFVSDVSHELRTPLTNLSLYLDLLTKTSDPDRGLNYMEALRRETNRLTHLIEDLLTISRLEADRLEISIQPIDAGSLVANLAVDRLPMAASQMLDLNFVCPESTPQAWADPRILTQVVSNLLTNALNYTLTGGKITLEIRHQSNSNGNWVVIHIIDTGVGITPDEQQNLFTRFYRGSASDLTGAPGTGLGLAISKELSELMGGHITFESTPGTGSTFSVWLRAVL